MIEYLIPASVITFCSYMTYRGQQKRKKINERMQKFQEEIENVGSIRLDDSHGYYEYLQSLAKKYNMLVIPSSTIKEEIRINPNQALEGRIFLN